MRPLHGIVSKIIGAHAFLGALFLAPLASACQAGRLQAAQLASPEFLARTLVSQCAECVTRPCLDCVHGDDGNGLINK